MLSIELSAADITRSRFGISPLAETIAALQTLTSPDAPPAALRAWAGRAGLRLERLRAGCPDLMLLLNAVTGRYVRLAYFLIPAPGLPARPVAAELATLQEIPGRLSQSQLRDAVADRPWLEPGPAARLREQGTGARLAELLHLVWRELVAPEWPSISAIMRRDIQYRSQLLLAGGWEALSPTLGAPRFRWISDGGALRFHSPVCALDYRCPPNQGGLIFAPTVLGTSITLALGGPHRVMLYPASGTDVLNAPAAAPGGELASLIGGRRARILAELDRPASTTQLCARFEFSLGTVGYHLSVLSRNGLIVGTRSGQSVVYELTTRGRALLEANLAS